LLAIAIAFIIIYTIKFSFFRSFSVTAKAIQFSYGYLILIPGFTVLFTYFSSITIKKILEATFWAISIELFIEFILIRILHVSPGSFAHYPKSQHITLDVITGAYTADRLLGLAGNASVTGVLYSAVFILYLGHLYLIQEFKLEKKNFLVIGTFLICFFMISSGSAFFAIVISLMVIWSQKKGLFLVNLLIALTIIPLLFLLTNYISTITDVFGNKFTTDYLYLLLATQDVEGTLPNLIQQMSVDYHWYHIFIGKYFYEWGNPDAIVKTVDYFYVNVVYEFGLIGLFVFFYIIKIGYNAIKQQQFISDTFLKFGILVIVLGSLHYPVIAYMAAQVFLSAIVAVAIRDRSLANLGHSNLLEAN
jgi:hypothetical protein